MQITKTPVTVYAESTPNPATMKFVANKMLIQGDFAEYTTPEKTADSPLAAALFNFPFVAEVFISGNFVAITKIDSIDWNDVVLELREFVRDYINAGKEIVTTRLDAPATEQNETNTLAPSTPDTEIEQKIIELLETYVRPAVEQDGGAIHFKSFHDGVVTLVLRGACSGCPSASRTLKSGIEGLLRKMLPEVKEVVAEEL